MQPDDRLDAWGLCHELAVRIYRVTAAWPANEVYGLAAQARRAMFAAVVYAANDPPVPDLTRRRYRIELALACIGRLRYALLLAHELGYMPTEDWEAVSRLAARAEESVRGELARLATSPRLLR